MPVLLQINVDANNGSNGAIARNIGHLVVQKGWNSYIAYGRKHLPTKESKLIRIGTDLDVTLHGLISRLFDYHGLGSSISTNRFLKEVDRIRPDIVHLHNIHGYYINYKLLFNYLRVKQIPTVWTLHDCWPMTGHCAHFVSANCEKWRTGCNQCPLKKNYPKSLFFDRSEYNYELKKKLFTSLERLHVIAVSEWVGQYARDSFLGKYPVSVIHNGIDLGVFKPCKDYIFRQNIAKSTQKIVLGVAVSWSNSKGIKEFVELSKDNRFKVVMVGVDETLRKKLPNSILTVSKTESQEELAKYYSNADVFLNPTYADTFPTVNLESLACGTPIVTYRTGGSPEAISKETGLVVDCGDYMSLKKAVEQVSFSRIDYTNFCRKRAEILFNKDDRYKDYLKIYESLLR